MRKHPDARSVEDWAALLEWEAQRRADWQALADALRAQNEQQQAALDLAIELLRIADERVSGDPATTAVKGKGGRPKKKHLTLEVFTGMRREFAAANPNVRATDKAVLTWWWGREFERHGQRPSRAVADDFQAKLKTTLNALSAARKSQAPES